MKENKVEAESGTRTHRTDEEKQRLVHQITELHRKGMPIKDAAKKLGVQDNSFYAWRKRFGAEISAKRAFARAVEMGPQLVALEPASIPQQPKRFVIVTDLDTALSMIRGE